MKGGIAFYSGHPVVDLRSEESIQAFLASGGESIVVKASKLDRLPAAADFDVFASFRSGRRQVVIVSPSGSKTPPERHAGVRTAP